MPSNHPFPDQFCPVGSGTYYAIRFAPKQFRSSLSLANAIYHCIGDVPAQCTEPTVAAQKIQWWQDELQRAFQGKAQHPVARRSALLAQQSGLNESFFLPLFEATWNRIDGIAIGDEAQLEHFLDQNGGVYGELIGLAGGADKSLCSQARAIGRFLTEAESLIALGADLRKNCILLPSNRLQKFGLKPTGLLDAEASQITPLLENSITQIRANYQRLLRSTTTVKALGTLLSLAALADRLLSMVAQESAYKIIDQRTELTPLHKLWICWRCQRKLR